MDFMDFVDQIGELKNTIYSLKAAAVAFAGRYTQGNDESNLLSVKIDPETFCYLFQIITDLIQDSKDKVTDLTKAADRILEGSEKK